MDPKFVYRLLRWPGGKEPTYQCRKCGFNPWVGKILWKREWQCSPVFLLGKSHGQRSLVGSSPGGHKKAGHHLATKQQQQQRLHAILLGSIKDTSVFISEMLSTFSQIFNTQWLMALTFIVLVPELVNETVIFRKTGP